MGLAHWTVLAVSLLGLGGLLLFTVRDQARAAAEARAREVELQHMERESVQLRRLLLAWTWQVVEQVDTLPTGSSSVFLVARAQEILEYLETLNSHTEACVDRVDLAQLLPRALNGAGVAVHAAEPAWALVPEAKFERCILNLVQLIAGLRSEGESLTLRVQVRSDTILLEFEPLPFHIGDTGDLRWLMATHWFSALGISIQQYGRNLQLVLPRNDPNPEIVSGEIRAVKLRKAW